MNLLNLQRAPSYITIKEISDPASPIEYSGLALADYTSKVQRWTLLETGDGDEMLFIDEHHQSSKSDEFRYHETFVHSLLSGMPHAKKVLVLGGAEGCMLREILKWSNVENITQVDWDDTLVGYFKNEGAVWNRGAYNSPKVKYVCDEAIHWLDNNTEKFDAIFIDLLDPLDTSMIFMKTLISHCKIHLNINGGLSVNGGRVYNHPSAICKVADYMKSLFKMPEFGRTAIRVHVPTYQGIWCFLMATPLCWTQESKNATLPKRLKYYNQERLSHNTYWDSNYPSEIQHYSQLSSSEKEEQTLSIKVFEHHGC